MKKEQYLRIAEIIAETSHCSRKKVGAVIVKEGRIISTGYNGIPKPRKKECHTFRLLEAKEQGYIVKAKNCNGCLDVIHAEQNAILAAAKEGISLEGSELYVTLSPCIECAKAIVMSGIKKVYFSRRYKGDPGEIYLKSLGIPVEYINMWEVNHNG